jgi:hypothetical protein
VISLLMRSAMPAEVQRGRQGDRISTVTRNICKTTDVCNWTVAGSYAAVKTVTVTPQYGQYLALTHQGTWLFLLTGRCCCTGPYGCRHHTS